MEAVNTRTYNIEESFYPIKENIKEVMPFILDLDTESKDLDEIEPEIGKALTDVIEPKVAEVKEKITESLKEKGFKNSADLEAFLGENSFTEKEKRDIILGYISHRQEEKFKKIEKLKVETISANDENTLKPLAEAIFGNQQQRAEKILENLQGHKTTESFGAKKEVITMSLGTIWDYALNTLKPIQDELSEDHPDKLGKDGSDFLLNLIQNLKGIVETCEPRAIKKQKTTIFFKAQKPLKTEKRVPPKKNEFPTGIVQIDPEDIEKVKRGEL